MWVAEKAFQEKAFRGLDSGLPRPASLAARSLDSPFDSQSFAPGVPCSISLGTLNEQKSHSSFSLSPKLSSAPQNHLPSNRLSPRRTDHQPPIPPGIAHPPIFLCPTVPHPCGRDKATALCPSSPDLSGTLVW